MNEPSTAKGLRRLWGETTTFPDPRMGNDGTGHCRDCGCAIDRFNEDCEVCMCALDVIGGVRQ
jgi:hypothetical protein